MDTLHHLVWALCIHRYGHSASNHGHWINCYRHCATDCMDTVYPLVWVLYPLMRTIPINSYRHYICWYSHSASILIGTMDPLMLDTLYQFIWTLHYFLWTLWIHWNGHSAPISLDTLHSVVWTLRTLETDTATICMNTLQYTHWLDLTVNHIISVFLLQNLQFLKILTVFSPKGFW